MRKIWSKIRKIFVTIGVTLFTFGTSVFSSYEPAYGVMPVKPTKPEPSFWEKVLPIIKLVFIPLLLIIGLVIYWKKSKADKKEKIYITVGIILLVVVIYVIVTVIENSEYISKN